MILERKIQITTWYEITEADGEERKFKIVTETPSPLNLQGIFDLHNEKVGAIERKLLK